MIVAGTGHRPEKLGGHSFETFERLTAFALEELSKLSDVRVVISGMALGWDMALATAALHAKIPFFAALPFADQASRWPDEWQAIHATLLKHASMVEVCSPGLYQPYMMQRRNRWMVDACSDVLALWNGTAGGTRNCILYAEERRRPIINVWDAWQAFQR